MFRGFLGSFLNDMMSSHKSNLEGLLDKEDTKLETLLEDGDILTQCKWGNQKLINYFDHDKVSELIDFIITMPPEGCSHDRGHKFPFVASEIFNCELNKVNDIFFQARPQNTQKTAQNTNQKGGKGKYSIQSDEDDDDDNRVGQLEQNNLNDNHLYDQDGDVHMSNQDDDDHDNDFDKLIASDVNNNDDGGDNDNNVVIRKSFGDTLANRGSFGNKPASNRYEIQDDEEVDQDEIELRADETIDGAFNNADAADNNNNQVEDTVAATNDLNDGHIEIIDDDQEEDKQQDTDNNAVIVDIDADTEVQTKDKPIDELVDNLNKQVDSLEEQEEQKTEQITTAIQDDYINEEEQQKDQITNDDDSEQQQDQQQQEHNHQIIEDEINLEDDDDEDDNRTISTAVTKQDHEIKQHQEPNEYELFEKLLSFLDTDEELNPVLTGYFCKLFQVLVGNKPKEVFGYIYSHPNILDNFVKHLNDKSISEILIRLLNVSDNIFDDNQNDNENKDTNAMSSEFDGIRQSYIYKIVQKLAPSNTFEDHLNAQSVLSELAEYKLVYQELTSQRCLDAYNEYLQSGDSATSKAAVYQLLQSIAQKYKQNEHFSKKINISNFQDCGDDMMLDDEEDVLVFNEDKESPFFNFVKKIVSEHVAKELAIPHEDDQEDLYARQYGICKEPFGMVRIRAVEFLSQVYQIFFKDIHSTLADADLYNTLLFFFDHYPFHNILHLKVNDIFTLALDKNNEAVINHFLYQTSLIKKILDTFRDNGGIHTFVSTGQTVNRGYIAFMRKLANKIVELSKKNEEVLNFLESIPEWEEFYNNVLIAINTIESKPLGSDPRKKDHLSSSDDYFDMIYKIKNKGASLSKSKQQHNNNNNNNDDDDDDEDDQVLNGDADDQDGDNDNNQDGNNGGNGNNNNQNDDDEDEDANRNKDLYFSNELGAGKSRNKRNKAYAQDNNDGEEEEEDNDFDRLIYRRDDDDDDGNHDRNDHAEDNNDLQQYFSNGDDQTKKPWESQDYHEEEDGQGLSMNDLDTYQQEVETPKFHQPPEEEEEEEIKIEQQEQQIDPQVDEDNKNNSGLAVIEAQVDKDPEVPTYHAQFFWKDNLSNNNDELLDALLQDYE